MAKMTLKREPESCKNGIRIFSSSILDDNEDYNASGLEILHKTENNHFWFIGRKERILSVFDRYIDREGSFLEVGAGTGNVSKSDFRITSIVSSSGC
jgi:hypothetical protein